MPSVHEIREDELVSVEEDSLLTQCTFWQNYEQEEKSTHLSLY